MRVAIVGAGVSGLVCAHLLSDRHDITVFEANDYAGGHTNTVRVDTADETHRVDTGFIVLNDRTYPNFERLLSRLGVATQQSDMSFSVSDGGDFEYNGSGPNGLFARRSHLVRPSFHRMIRDLLRFNREAPALVGLNGSGPSLGEFLDDGGYSAEFVERLIVPQASAVWSADPNAHVGVPGEHARRVLRQSRDVRPQRAAQLADDHRRLRPLRGGDHPAARQTGCGCPRRCAAWSAARTAWRSRPPAASPSASTR